MAEWKVFLGIYLVLGALIILATKARQEVFGALSAQERRQFPVWKTVAFYCITTPVALLFWPIFLPSWLRKKDTIWDALNAPKANGRGLKELFEAMNSLAEGGCDTDEVPGAEGRFGWDVSNPIPTNTTFGSTSYLARLRTADGDSVEYERIGSFDSPISTMPVDGYELTDGRGNELGVLYLSPYHKRNSRKAPEGLQIID